jgi:hypothetical protein
MVVLMLVELPPEELVTLLTVDEPAGAEPLEKLCPPTLPLVDPADPNPGVPPEPEEKSW